MFQHFLGITLLIVSEQKYSIFESEIVIFKLNLFKFEIRVIQILIKNFSNFESKIFQILNLK